MRLGRNDFAFIKGGSKPSAMALRLTDKLFSKATLIRSTVHGTKDFEPLDPTETGRFACKSFRLHADWPALKSIRLHK